jgi:RimJ/RimL family protein N-acetyltransferase
MSFSIRPMKRSDVGALHDAMTPDDFRASYSHEYDGTWACQRQLLEDGVSTTYVVIQGGDISGTITCDDACEVGFWIREDLRGQGLARSVMRTFFTLFARRQAHTAACWDDNMASRAVLLNLGFKQTGTDYLIGRRVCRFKRESGAKLIDANNRLRDHIDRDRVAPIEHRHGRVGGVCLDLHDML